MLNKNQIKELMQELMPNTEINDDGLPPAKLLPNPMLPAVLHLTLTKKWFDMIKSGEKKEGCRIFIISLGRVLSVGA